MTRPLTMSGSGPGVRVMLTLRAGEGPRVPAPVGRGGFHNGAVIGEDPAAGLRVDHALVEIEAVHGVDGQADDLDHPQPADQEQRGPRRQ